MAKFFFHSNIHLNRDISKGLMEMQGREMREGKEDAFRNAFRNSRISRIGGGILEAIEIVLRAVLFVVIVLAIELCVMGLCYVACGRW